MPGIVCAIRGGPASKPTIARSIALAKETDLPLFFCTSLTWISSLTPPAAGSTLSHRKWSRWVSCYPRYELHESDVSVCLIMDPAG